ncbi:hypothetical protein GWK26_12560 [haloarchaeon 3A1-DGR]|nr:hypothetical protein GWK26_12560 [haloarchaeon 3A1-DGR]
MSSEKHYLPPGDGADPPPLRENVTSTGELTNGERVSSKRALIRRWRRLAPDVDDAIVRQAAAGIVQLKQQDVDDWALWFALAEWLGDPHRSWMRPHAPIRDPATGRQLFIEHAGHRLKFEDRGVEGRADRTETVREHVADVYETAFGDRPDRIDVLHSR